MYAGTCMLEFDPHNSSLWLGKGVLDRTKFRDSQGTGKKKNWNDWGLNILTLIMGQNPIFPIMLIFFESKV